MRISNGLRVLALLAAAALAVTTALTVSAATATTVRVAASAAPCQTVWASGSHFSAGQTGILTYNGARTATFTASAAGSFDVPLEIPDWAVPNSTGRISAKTRWGGLIATTTLGITNKVTSPTLWVPAQASPGQQIVVGGGGMTAGATGNLTINGTIVRPFTVETDGAFSLPFTIPAGQVLGSARVSAKSADGTLIATTTLGIVAASSTWPPSPTPTPTNAGTPSPTAAPTATPAPTATVKPTSSPTVAPTAAPTPTATVKPTPSPTVAPTATPTPTATVKPTPSPTAAPTASPPGAPGTGGSVYGPGIGFDTKDNLPVGGSGQGKVAHRFRASTSSALTAIRWAQRGGPGGYAAGDGGTVRISVEADVNGQPSGTPLASLTYVLNWPGGAWAPFNQQTFASPATLTAGQLYDIVFENVTADPVNNFISVNEVFVYNYSYSPRQPGLSDDYAILYSENGGSYAVRPRDTADMDLTYADGHHDGQAYIEAMAAQAAYISGATDMAREHFTVSGGDRTVSSASVRVLRLSGSGSNPLTVTLETGSGQAIESVDIPSSSVPVSTVGDTSAGTWVTAMFTVPHTLTNGQTYNLRLSTGSGITYVAIPIREGTDSGFNSYRFTDGDGQKTTDGSSWANCYAYSPVDLQFYFR